MSSPRTESPDTVGSVISRRGFVGTILAATALPAGLKGAVLGAGKIDDIPIIDTHIHLFDPTRPGGVPWPTKDNAILYKPALPARYRQLAAPFGIKGAIEVECSTLLEDNQWVLDAAGKDTIMVGTVGNLDPGVPEFRAQLDRFHRNPLFRGIRYGNLWGRDLGAELAKPEFVAGLKALADAGLALDTANPNPALIEAVVHVTDKVPNLRVIIDHLPQLNPPAEAAALAAYQANLKELGRRSQVYIKVSEVLRRVDGKVPEDLGFYRARLEDLWGVFGEDRVLFGSDWPNSDQWAEFPKVLNVVREFFATKGRAAAEKYFWKNSVAAYRWMKRDASQPSLG
ncbi:MAG TPA: amidohydrolase family protein [Opitutaceae bacterium]|nr:amidohydrolase family protein [Opitutaceae bacterium]